MTQHFVCCVCLKRFVSDFPKCLHCGSTLVFRLKRTSSECNDRIQLRGDLQLWFDFVNAVKKQQRTVWEVLSGFMQYYIQKTKEEEQEVQE